MSNEEIDSDEIELVENEWDEIDEEYFAGWWTLPYSMNDP